MGGGYLTAAFFMVLPGKCCQHPKYQYKKSKPVYFYTTQPYMQGSEKTPLLPGYGNRAAIYYYLLHILTDMLQHYTVHMEIQLTPMPTKMEDIPLKPPVHPPRLLRPGHLLYK
jgi:hypothetical protein